VTLLLSLPMVIVIFAGAVLAQRAGSSDLIAVLAAPGGIAIGNILIALAVVAPTFTTFYSGAPGLRAAIGIGEKPAMVLMAVVGLVLAAVHFDELLLPWLGVLGAVLPPITVPLAVEFYMRRRGRAPRLVPVWPWLAGAGLAAILAMWRSQRMPARARPS
jgi:cytosine permease